MDVFNPIRSVDGVVDAVKSPSVYQWDLQDISDSEAGRTEDTVMHKNRIGQCVKLELQWNGVDNATVSKILKAFNPEYITVCYLDAMEGDYVTSVFYVGDRSAPMYNNKMNLWQNVKFNLIERSG